MAVPLELITMGIGAASGFVFKFLSEKDKRYANILERSIKANQEADKSANLAATRVNDEAGKRVRRLIVIAVLISIVLIPAILPFFHIPIVTEIVENKPILGGLLGERTRHVFVEVKGWLLIPEMRSVFTAIAGYYFGQGSAK